MHFINDPPRNILRSLVNIHAGDITGYVRLCNTHDDAITGNWSLLWLNLNSMVNCNTMNTKLLFFIISVQTLCFRFYSHDELFILNEPSCFEPLLRLKFIPDYKRNSYTQYMLKKWPAYSLTPGSTWIFLSCIIFTRIRTKMEYLYNIWTGISPSWHFSLNKAENRARVL